MRCVILGKILRSSLNRLVLETSRESADWASANAQSFVQSKTEQWRKTAEVSFLSKAEQKIFMDTVRPLGDKLLGGHKNPQVRELYGMLKASAKRHAPKM